MSKSRAAQPAEYAIQHMDHFFPQPPCPITSILYTFSKTIQPPFWNAPVSDKVGKARFVDSDTCRPPLSNLHAMPIHPYKMPTRRKPSASPPGPHCSVSNFSNVGVSAISSLSQFLHVNSTFLRNSISTKGQEQPVLQRSSNTNGFFF